MSRKLFVISALCLLPTAALANGPDELGLHTEERIYNGQDAPLCSWPTTVAVQNGGSLCTGTLVHPQVVLYAAHCGASGTRIKFGESSSGGTGHSVDCLYSKTNPGYGGTGDQGHDWSYCVLPEPVWDIPTTPVVFGCELSVLQAGAQIAIAGFGQTENSGAGIKHWGMTTLTSVDLNGGRVTLGGNGLPSVCPGDSGGPAFIRYPDNSWHAFGIASTVSGGCGGFGTHALMANAVPWVEGDSKVDITTCFTQAGDWEPGPFCGDFYSGEPGMGYGDWSGEWCQGTPRLAFSETCGPPFGGDDEEPPTVAIQQPADGTEYEDCPADVMVVVDAADDSGYLKSVSLEIDDAPLENSAKPDEPYEYNLTVPKGQYKLVAVAEDFAGNITKSSPVGFGVCEPPPDVGDSGDGTGEDGMDEGEAGTGTGPTTGLTGGDEDPGDSGCGCSSSNEGRGVPAMAFGLGILLLSLRRRRV